MAWGFSSGDNTADFATIQEIMKEKTGHNIIKHSSVCSGKQINAGTNYVAGQGSQDISTDFVRVLWVSG